jgi:hypothetical protein
MLQTVIVLARVCQQTLMKDARRGLHSLAGVRLPVGSMELTEHSPAQVLTCAPLRGP